MINKSWFTEKINAKGLSQRKLAEILGCDPSQISLLLNGQRRFHLEDAEKWADALRVPVEDVLSAVGVLPEGPRGWREIPMTGTVDAEGNIQPKLGETVKGASFLPDDAVAVQVRAPGNFMDGWVAFFDGEDRRDPISTALTLAVVDGKYLGVVRRGYKPDSINIDLAGHIHTIENPEWACPVLMIKP